MKSLENWEKGTMICSPYTNSTLNYILHIGKQELLLRYN